jgi:hypothetical protein
MPARLYQLICRHLPACPPAVSELVTTDALLAAITLPNLPNSIPPGYINDVGASAGVATLGGPLQLSPEKDRVRPRGPIAMRILAMHCHACALAPVTEHAYSPLTCCLARCGNLIWSPTFDVLAAEENLGNLAPTSPEFEPEPAPCPLILCKTRDIITTACRIFEDGGLESEPQVGTAHLGSS